MGSMMARAPRMVYHSAWRRVNAMSIDGAQTNGVVGKCSRCGEQVALGQTRYHQSQLLCETCWDELLRIGVLKWLPFDDEGAGRPHVLTIGELARR